MDLRSEDVCGSRHSLLRGETVFAKETKRWLKPLRKAPRPYTLKGLQYVLSGDQVIIAAMQFSRNLKGNRPYGDSG